MDSSTALKNWRALRDALKNINERDAAALLEAEKTGLGRPTFLHRIYGKFAILRAQRERRELQLNGD